MIAINKTSSSVAWIIRVAPAVALCHIVYAIYHLCRSATGRTPASTASYMIFAAMLDTGLIPFFVFSAVMAQADYTKNTYGWSTLFNDSNLSYKVIYAFFVLSCCEGSLLLVSLIVDVYLAVMFRKIAKLPPDMNPLEPNLTARPNSHKRNKSEMTATEKSMNGSALAARRELGVAGTRRVPFIHTRTDSADSVTLYGDMSARNSRTEFRKDLMDHQKDPYRLSQETVVPSRPGSAVNPSAHPRSAGAGRDHHPSRSSELTPRNSRPSSWLSYLDYEGVPTPLSPDASVQLDRRITPLSPVSAGSTPGTSWDRTRAERENWYRGSAKNSPAQLTTNKGQTHPPPYQASVIQDVSHESLMPPPSGQRKKRSREPLSMNPPTPPLDRYQDENVFGHGQTQVVPVSEELRRDALKSTDGNARARPTVVSRPSSFVGSGGKSRFYGDLRSSIGSITSTGEEPKRDVSVRVREVDDDGRTKTMQSGSDDSGNIEVYDDGSSSEAESHGHGHISLETTREQQWNGVRQVSNSTGYDLHGSYAGLGVEFGQGMGRRREVSGKVAEEGRGGQASRGGAAGWARFKGL